MAKYFKYIAACFTVVLISSGIQAQDEDLLKLLGPDKPKKEIVKNAFKSPRVIMGQSVEFLRPGTMDFRILHRFGQLNQGYKNFFGLDQASMRMGFDFGIMKNLQVGIGRSTFNKELDAYFKYAPFQQSTGKGAFPVTIAFVSGITMTGTDWADPSRKNFFTSRLGYFFQAVIGGRVTDGLSLQVTPTVIHKNLIKLAADSNNIYAAGIGGRLRLSRRISLTWDYFYVLNPLTDYNYKNPVGIGFDIETGGHVFQLHFTNATGMNEKAFITETTGDLLKGEIRFGFNLSRVFQIKKKKTE
ncbi:MAG: hypothetical protein IPP93_00935 [Chitinophagaceae bacterium]|nr:hypothetical protein [Chitinophagaceae bacterium]MBL0336230.1 hypothetical protein [Chitinophagaceae bacterium]